MTPNNHPSDSRRTGDTYYTAGDYVGRDKITQVGDRNVGVHIGDASVLPAAQELNDFLDFLTYLGVVTEGGVADQAELEDQLHRRAGRLGRVVEALKAGGVQALEAAVRHVAVPAVLQALDRQQH